MKKNAMLKIAAILMVAVLLTTCAISSTFAKYTTTAATKDVKARVAKWGVELETSLDGLFDTAYAANSSSQYNPVVDPADDDANTTDTVISATTMNLMAPGTSGQTKALSTVKGTPEVAVRVVNKLELNLSGWVDDYCPIVFTVNTVDYSVDDIDVDSDDYKNSGAASKLAYLEKLVEDAVAATSVDYAPNTDLSTADAFAVVISWDWSYDGHTDYDNTIGNAAAKAQDETAIAAVEIKFTQSITQID